MPNGLPWRVLQRHTELERSIQKRGIPEGGTQKTLASGKQEGRQQGKAQQQLPATLSSRSVESTTQGCGFCSVQEENDEGDGSDYYYWSRKCGEEETQGEKLLCGGGTTALSKFSCGFSGPNTGEWATNACVLGPHTRALHQEQARECRRTTCAKLRIEMGDYQTRGREIWWLLWGSACVERSWNFGWGCASTSFGALQAQASQRFIFLFHSLLVASQGHSQMGWDKSHRREEDDDDDPCCDNDDPHDNGEA